MKRLIKKHRKNIVEISKFGVIGGLGYIATVIPYNAFVHFGTNPIFAKHPIWAVIISNFLGILVTWLGNRFWTFKHGKNESAVKESLIFFGINAGLVFFPVLCLFISREVLHLTSLAADNISANIIGIGIGTIIRYFFYKFVLFNPNKNIKK